MIKDNNILPKVTHKPKSDYVPKTTSVPKVAEIQVSEKGKMRVLLFFNGIIGDATREARRIHMDFIFRLREYVHFFSYGPGESCRVPHVAPIPFDSKLSACALVRRLRPDVVMVYSCFTVKEWLPSDFAEIPVPKVIIEVDYWDAKNIDDSWYKRYGFDLLVQRGYYTMSPIPAVWLPFSANENDFCRYQFRKKSRRLVFVGATMGVKTYAVRRKILRILQQNDLITVHGRVGHSRYPEVLGKAKYAFCDPAGNVQTTPAKIFEIMACGGLLLTSYMQGEKELFGEKPCYVKYKPDLSNLEQKAIEMLQGRYDSLVAQSIKIVNDYHLDCHRIKELVAVLKALVKSEEVPKRWGH